MGHLYHKGNLVLEGNTFSDCPAQVSSFFAVPALELLHHVFHLSVLLKCDSLKLRNIIET